MVLAAGAARAGVAREEIVALGGWSAAGGEGRETTPEQAAAPLWVLDGGIGLAHGSHEFKTVPSVSPVYS